MSANLACLCLIFLCLKVAAQKAPPLLELSVATGYQSADLRWSIAGNMNGNSPDILSEVKWKKLAGPVVSGTLQVNLIKKCFLAVSISGVAIRAGLATDSDYGADGRQGRTYYADLDADDGMIHNRSIYLGYEVLNTGRILLSVKAGYQQSEDRLHLLDHKSYVPGERNLRSTYDTQWQGISGGIKFRYRIFRALMLNDEINYGQMNYRATADWNRIDAFQHPVSFRQRASGFDLRNTLSCAYQLKPFLTVLLACSIARSETGHGIDDLYLASGITQSTRFNGAVRNLKNIGLGLAFNL